MAKEVSVTMTEAQKERVVDLLAKESAPKEVKKVTLVFQHERNNVKYGPGTVEVEAGLASALFAQDQLRFNNRLRENEGGDNLVEIVGAGHTRKIR